MNLYLRGRGRHHNVWPIEHLAIEHFAEFLNQTSGLAHPFDASKNSAAVDLELEKWRTFLETRRGLCQGSIRIYLQHARAFVGYVFGNTTPVFSAIDASQIVDFYRARARGRSSFECKSMTTALRSFCRYLVVSGMTGTDLSRCVPMAAHWSFSDLPRALPFEVARAMIEGLDRTTVAGKRDAAVLLLLSHLGLRAGEVAHILLEDIDWSEGTLWVRRRKSLSERLPLPKVVGVAIAGYLVSGRPVSESRRLFLRIPGPHVGFSGCAAVGDIVRKALTSNHIATERYGAHQLRHGLAIEMLNRGSTIAEIGQVLGHRSLGATSVYVKVDFGNLRQLAAPWPTETNGIA
jgi:site-specific recombinase XerD